MFLNLEGFFYVLFSGSYLSAHTKQNLSIHSISENGRKPVKKISASATVLLTLKVEVQSPYNRITISYNRKGHRAFAVFLLSIFVGKCRRAVSDMRCRSPPLHLDFLHFKNSDRQFGYEIYPLSLDKKQIEAIDFDCGYIENSPAFYRFDFEADELCDTFLNTDGFDKGCAFINGFNLGRFWKIGPQKRLYIPAPLLKKGKNTIIIFETEGNASDSILLCKEADLG